MDVFAHNDALNFSEKLTKIAGAHGMKFGFVAERGRKQQNFQNDEMGYMDFDPWATGGTGNALSDMLTGRLSTYRQGTQIPEGNWRYWNYDMFAQDSWKLKSNFTLEFGVRGGYWTNNEELQHLAGYFDPSFYNASKGTFLDPGTYKQLNGWRYNSLGQAPLGGVPNRTPFAMPRDQRRMGRHPQWQERRARRGRHVLQPEHGQPGVRLPAHSADVVPGEYQLIGRFQSGERSRSDV